MSQNGRRLLTIGGLGLICSVLILIITPPATGYELSTYQEIPGSFWIFYAIAMFAAVSTLIRLSLSRNLGYTPISAITVIIVANLVVISIPIWRGYAIYPSGDVMTHLGYIADIQNHGRFSSGNIYPPMHIFSTSLSLIIPQFDYMGRIYSVIFTIYIVFMASVYILGRRMGGDPGSGALTFIWVSPLIFTTFHFVFHPSFLSILLIPLILIFLLHGLGMSENARISVLCILSALIVLTHPLTGLFLIFILLSLFIFSKFASSNLKEPLPQYRVSLGVFSVASVIWIAWIQHLNRTATRVVDVLFIRDATPLLEETVQNVSGYSPSALVLGQRLIFELGIALLFLSLALFISFIGIRFGRIYRKGESQISILYYLVLIFLGAIVFSLASLLGDTGERSILRVLRFPLLLSPVILGVSLNFLFRGFLEDSIDSLNRMRITRKSLYLIIFVLIILASQSAFNGHRDFIPNKQVTYAEVDGMEWLLSHAEKDSKVIGMGINPDRFDHMLRGTSMEAHFHPHSLEGSIPSHFGLDGDGFMGWALENTILISNEKREVAHRVFPESLLPVASVFEDRDFKNLDEEKAVLNYFDNGGIEIRSLRA